MTQSTNTTIVAIPYFENGIFKVADAETMKDITLTFEQSVSNKGNKYDDPKYRVIMLSYHFGVGHLLTGEMDAKLKAMKFSGSSSFAVGKNVLSTDLVKNFQKNFPKGQLSQFFLDYVDETIKRNEELKKKTKEAEKKAEKKTAEKKAELKLSNDTKVVEVAKVEKATAPKATKVSKKSISKKSTKKS